MRNLNEAFITGKIASDIKVSTFGERDTKVANFSIMSSEKTVSLENGTRYQSSFIRVTAWGRFAEKAENLSKGDSILVQGRIDRDDYETDDGEKRTIYKINATNVDQLKESEYGEDINRVLVYGYCSEIKEDNIQIDEGIASVKFSLATSRYVKDDREESGFKQFTTWHNIKIRTNEDFYNKVLSELDKGTLLMLEGSIKTSSWEDQNGNKKYWTNLLVKEEGILGIFGKEYVNDDSDVKEEKTENKVEEKPKKEIKEKEPKKVSRPKVEEKALDDEEVEVGQIPF